MTHGHTESNSFFVTVYFEVVIQEWTLQSVCQIFIPLFDSYCFSNSFALFRVYLRGSGVRYIPFFKKSRAFLLIFHKKAECRYLKCGGCVTEKTTNKNKFFLFVKHFPVQYIIHRNNKGRRKRIQTERLQRMKIKALLLLLFFAAWMLQAKEVIFIPGWLTENAPMREEERMLAETFPGYPITIKRWQSGTEASLLTATRNNSWYELHKPWGEARKKSELFAVEVARYISAMPPEQQREVILIGHSLGGRCVVHTAALLRKENIRIDRVILLGAAIHNTDESLSACGEISLRPALNLYNYQDSVLRYLYANFERSRAAGQVGTKKQFTNFRNFRVTGSDKADTPDLWQQIQNVTLHFIKSYLAELQNALNSPTQKEKIDHDAVWANVSTPAPIPDYFSMPHIGSVSETYNGWTFSCIATENLPVIVRKLIPQSRFTPKYVYIITDPSGRMMMLPSYYLGKWQWNRVKSLIDANGGR